MVELVVVDSTILIGLLRRGRDPVKTLGAWAGPRDLGTCGMIRLEVLRGVRSPRIHGEMSQFLDVMVQMPSTEAVWRAAADLAWKMDRRGEVIPSSDLLIAVIAMSAGAAVISDDAHFRRIPGLTIFHPSSELAGW